MAKKKSEQIQLELHHAMDDLVDDISEKMEEGRTEAGNGPRRQPKEYCRPSIRGRTIFGKSLRMSYPDQLRALGVPNWMLPPDYAPWRVMVLPLACLRQIGLGQRATIDIACGS